MKSSRGLTKTCLSSKATPDAKEKGSDADLEIKLDPTTYPVNKKLARLATKIRA
jgi:hypothetical protein